jgi:hypothetical protein
MLNTWLAFLVFTVSFVFGLLVLRRYLARPRAYLLLWGAGMLLYATGGFCAWHHAVFGWNPFVFRVWYLSGAVLVAAWLGQGTLFLLARRWARPLMAVLTVASLYAALRVFTAELDPARMLGAELSGHAIVTPGVRLLTPFFNVYGTLALAGGAAWSAWLFWRKRVLPHRTLGNLLIAAGALMPAMTGLFSRLGLPGVLYLGQLLGAALMFAGFLRASTPMERPAPKEPARG